MLDGSSPAGALREARHPALFLANGIGDNFVNLPAVRAVARLFPGRLELICDRAADAIFAEISAVRVHHVSTTMAGGTRRFDAARAAACIPRCDLLISLNPWHSDCVDELLARVEPSHSIGFFPTFGRHVPLDCTKHSADLAFDVPLSIDSMLRLEDFSAPPRFSHRLVERAARIWRAVPRRYRLLTVHADTAPHKMWPREKFVRLLDLFLQERRDFLALVLGLIDLRLDVGQHRNRVISACRLPLPVSALLVEQSDAFVGIDSSLLHAADLFRVPGVGLFGPTSAQEWGFRFGPHLHLPLDADEGVVCAALIELIGSSRHRKQNTGSR